MYIFGTRCVSNCGYSGLFVAASPKRLANSQHFAHGNKRNGSVARGGTAGLCGLLTLSSSKAAGFGRRARAKT